MYLALLVVAAVAATTATAAPSPTLEGEQLAGADLQSRCSYELTGWHALVSFQVSGTAAGSYAGTVTAAGTAHLYTAGGTTAALPELPARSRSTRRPAR